MFYKLRFLTVLYIAGAVIMFSGCATRQIVKPVMEPVKTFKKAVKRVRKKIKRKFKKKEVKPPEVKVVPKELKELDYGRMPEVALIDGRMPEIVLSEVVLEDPWNKTILVKVIIRDDGKLKEVVLPVMVFKSEKKTEKIIFKAEPGMAELVLRTTVLPEISFWTGKIYIVKSWKENRDCLWNIADWFYENPWKWKVIYKANKFQISDPDLIYPGQALRIP